jgi:hypothetical protein
MREDTSDTWEGSSAPTREAMEAKKLVFICEETTVHQPSWPKPACSDNRLLLKYCNPELNRKPLQRKMREEDAGFVASRPKLQHQGQKL